MLSGVEGIGKTIQGWNVGVLWLVVTLLTREQTAQVFLNASGLANLSRTPADHRFLPAFTLSTISSKVAAPATAITVADTVDFIVTERLL